MRDAGPLSRRVKLHLESELIMAKHAVDKLQDVLILGTHFCSAELFFGRQRNTKFS
jgi:hypothetical protein